MVQRKNLKVPLNSSSDYTTLWIVTFMLGLVFMMFVSVFVRLALVFGFIPVVTVLVNWSTVWYFFLCSTGLCTCERMINNIHTEDSH